MGKYCLCTKSQIPLQIPHSGIHNIERCGCNWGQKNKKGIKACNTNFCTMSAKGELTSSGGSHPNAVCQTAVGNNDGALAYDKDTLPART